MDPEFGDLGPFLLTWHGVFTAVAIAGAVWLILRLVRTRSIPVDDVYNAALPVVLGGIIGARALYVAENWDSCCAGDVSQVFALTEGGISAWGGVLGGAVAVLLYTVIARLPWGRVADVVTPGVILGMAIGRIGDIINGEHFAERSDLPWAVQYTHLNSPSNGPVPTRVLESWGEFQGLSPPQQPVVAYELIGALLIVGLLLWMLPRRFRDGMVAVAGFFLYSLLRFGVSFLRLDSQEVIGTLITPQVISLAIMALVALAFVVLRRLPPPTPETAASRAQAQRTRAERRRATRQRR